MTPDQLTAAVFSAASDAVRERDVYSAAEVELLLRAVALTWFAKGSQTALATVKAGMMAQDMGMMQ